MLARKFGRKKAHRNHMLRNLATSVILYERVETTEAKAKSVRGLVEKSITIAKKKTLAARRQLEALYFDSNAAKKLVETLADRYANRPSGFTTILRVGQRTGDRAEKFLLTLTPESEKSKKATAPVVETKETEDAKDS